jgi:hypothetical protein
MVRFTGQVVTWSPAARPWPICKGGPYFPAVINDDLPRSAQARIEEIVRRLAAGEVDALRSEGVKGLEGDPLLWVREYPAELVPLSADVWTHPEADSFAFDDGSGWAVVLPMWTTTESPSDLSLEMSVTKRGPGLEFEINNIHVM